jgi:hypothetical protein
MDGEDRLPALPHAAAGEWAILYPTLAMWLTLSAWDDGSHKAAGKLMVAIVRGRWVWTLKATGLGLMMEVETQLPEHGPEALEALLNASPPPWRVDPWEKVQQARKKKK